MVRNNVCYAVLWEGKGRLSPSLVMLASESIIILSQNIISYPVSQGTLINVAAFASDEQKAGTPFEGRWVSDVSQEEVEEAFHDFEPAAKNLLKVSLGVKSLMPPSTDESRHFSVVFQQSIKMGASCSK